MGVDLPLVWTAIILFSIMMYVVMDGFDLGIGILYPFFKDKEERDAMMNTVAPVWDGNETWLVLGGAGMLAAFPVAYSIILSAFYLPIVLMLLGLIFRGVAFEFRFKARDHERHLWDKAFIGGSIAATFFQGVILGAFIQGIAVEDKKFVGGSFDWISPFSIFTGFSLLFAFALLGSTWLIWRTEHALQQRAYAITRKLVWAMLAVLAIISIWTPLLDASIAARWFNLPDIFLFAPVPILVIVCPWLLLRSIKRGGNRMPFLMTLVLIFLAYSGLAISLFPNIVPPSLDIWQASSPPQSQGFAMVGALLIIPVILMYTVWSYYVFRGKVKIGEGYH